MISLVVGFDFPCMTSKKGTITQIPKMKATTNRTSPKSIFTMFSFGYIT